MNGREKLEISVRSENKAVSSEVKREAELGGRINKISNLLRWSMKIAFAFWTRLWNIL